MAVVFQRRCARANITAKAVHSVLKTLYISSALIFARCIYRLVEKTGNTTIRVDDPEILMALSPTLRYEWYFMVFEATLMLLNSVLWNVRHPRHHLPNSYRLHLAMDGRTEVEADEEPNVRSLLAHLIDPFGLYTGKKKQKDSFTELEEHSTVNH
jgi:hypothetical protein